MSYCRVFSYAIRLSVLIFSLSACQGSDESSSDAKGTDSTENQGQTKTPVKVGTQTENVVVEKQLLSLSSENLLFISSESVQAWSDRQKSELLCQLTFGSQFLIVEKKEDWVKIRLDRVSEKSPALCPEDANEAWISRDEAGLENSQDSPDISIINSPGPLMADISGDESICQLSEGDQIEILERYSATERRVKPLSGPCFDLGINEGWTRNAAMLTSAEKNSSAVRFTPHRLTFDLKVYGSAKKDEPPVCFIAKGNSVLVSKGTPQKIQMPKSKQCNPIHDFVWFSYVPGLWWEDQPK